VKNDKKWSKLKKINSITVRINGHKLVNVRMSLNKKSPAFDGASNNIKAQVLWACTFALKFIFHLIF
jgi:hypothetical protein